LPQTVPIRDFGQFGGGVFRVVEQAHQAVANELGLETTDSHEL
jgi:hypothetical protein